MRTTFPGTHLFLSPHPDDVAFSIGAALLDGRFDGGVLVNVFCVSRCTADDGDRDVDRVSARRRAEDAAFLSALPVRLERIYLDRLDAPLRLGVSEDRVCDVEPGEADRVERAHLVDRLRELRRGDGLLLAPLSLGGHVDHRIAHDAACELATAGWPVAFYEDLPYAGGVKLSEIASAMASTEARIGRTLEPVLLPAAECGARKLDVLEAYASQVDESTRRRIERHGARLGDGGVTERLWIAG